MSLKQAKKDDKLSPKYYGTYKVLQKISNMAYKLELHASSQVHPIFYVLMLKEGFRLQYPSSNYISGT